MAGIGAGVVVAAALLSYALLHKSAPPVLLAPVDTGMALIPAGSYTIGSSEGSDLQKPAHRVQLAAFGIDLHEVTVGEYQPFVDSGRVTKPWGAMPPANTPVTGVIWSEATNYCVARHGPSAGLPTEEQWEAAARGAAARRYPWGNQAEIGRANTAAERRNGVAAVGSYTRGNTPEGVQDLIGNVWEWTRTPMGAYPGGKDVPNVSLYFV